METLFGSRCRKEKRLTLALAWLSPCDGNNTSHEPRSEAELAIVCTVYRFATLLSSLYDRTNVVRGPRSEEELAVVCTISPSMHGLVRQCCPNAKVDSKSKCTNRKCDNVVYQLATLFPSPSRKCHHDVVYQLDTLLPSPCNRKKRLT